jgi:hypothetical protein
MPHFDQPIEPMTLGKHAPVNVDRRNGEPSDALSVVRGAFPPMPPASFRGPKAPLRGAFHFYDARSNLYSSIHGVMKSPSPTGSSSPRQRRI